MTTKQNDEPRTSENFKVQLDRAATEDSGILSTSQNIVDAAVEKVYEYVPTASRLLQGVTGNGPDKVTEVTNGSIKDDSKDSSKENVSSEDASFPARPHHDVQIEEFLRDQHRNKNGNSILKAARG